MFGYIAAFLGASIFNIAQGIPLLPLQTLRVSFTMLSDTFSDRTFVLTTSGSFVLLILSTVLSIFYTVMTTVRLDVREWLICTAVALSLTVAAEIRKAVLRKAVL